MYKTHSNFVQSRFYEHQWFDRRGAIWTTKVGKSKKKIIICFLYMERLNCHWHRNNGVITLFNSANILANLLSDYHVFDLNFF